MATIQEIGQVPVEEFRNFTRDNFAFRYTRRVFLKDWKEMRHNRNLFWSVILLPLVIAIVFPVMLVELLISQGTSPAEIYATASLDLNAMMKAMFLFVPVLVCAMIAGDSLAGEKDRKTAETLVVMPITQREIYIGKMLAAFLPAAFFSVVVFGVMGSIVNLVLWGAIPAGSPMLVFGDGTFWVVAFVFSPVFSLVMVQCAVMLSARLANARSAQQASMVFMIPVYVILFTVIGGNDMLSNIVFLWELSGILLGLAAVLAIIGGKTINREKFIATFN